MYDIKKLTNILIKYNITPNQFYILFCIYRKDWNNLHDYINNVSNKLNDEGRKITGFNMQDELKPLVKAGYLEHWGKNFEVLDLMITPLFGDLLFIDSLQAGRELYDCYPQWIIVNNSQQVAKKGGDIGGIYYGQDQMFELYAKKIGNSREKHEEIIRATERGKERNLITVSLRNYIHDELWGAYMELDEAKTKFKNI